MEKRSSKAHDFIFLQISCSQSHPVRAEDQSMLLNSRCPQIGSRTPKGPACLLCLTAFCSLRTSGPGSVLIFHSILQWTMVNKDAVVVPIQRHFYGDTCISLLLTKDLTGPPSQGPYMTIVICLGKAP